jgi:hypothetical protein
MGNEHSKERQIEWENVIMKERINVKDLKNELQ